VANVVIVGATKGMGRAVARILSGRGDAVFIAGRKKNDLEKSAADLAIRCGDTTRIGHKVFDLSDCLRDQGAILEFLSAANSFFHQVPIDTIVVTAGSFDTQEHYEDDLDACVQMLQLNFSATIAFCEHARKHLLRSGTTTDIADTDSSSKRDTDSQKTLCVFSSVAGDRGRKPVVLYGASKAGLSYYLEALDYRYRDKGLNVVCVKPGFVKTSMTSGLKPPPFAGEPDQVARLVVKAIDSGSPVIYAPKPWWVVMAVIKRLPRFVMRRLSF